MAEKEVPPGVGGAKPTSDEEDEVAMEVAMDEDPGSQDVTFPKTLEGFNYAFNEDGHLRDTETGEPFTFKVKEDQKYNQKRYEALGEVLNDYVYHLLETKAGLKRVYIPTDSTEGEAQSFIFLSEDALSNTDKLLILIHGSGVVRAGQWARRLIINDCLDSGTQLPFIRRAAGEGYGIMVLNTNLNHVVKEGKEVPVRENSCPEDHAIYVWEHFVNKAAAKHIAIVAHSYGGVVTTDLAISELEAFQQRVFAIAFTDSVHSLAHQKASDDVIKIFKQRAKNWRSSMDPLDKPLSSYNKADCPSVSAGHIKHEMTSWSAFESIFKFLAEKYPPAVDTNPDDGVKEEL